MNDGYSITLHGYSYTFGCLQTKLFHTFAVRVCWKGTDPSVVCRCQDNRMFYYEMLGSTQCWIQSI